MKDHYHQELLSFKQAVEQYSIFAQTMLRDSFDAFTRLDREQACEIAGGMEKYCIITDAPDGSPAMHQELEVPRKLFLRLRSDQLEEMGLRLLALHQPVAKDLRTIACCMNLVSSAERIGRYGKDICHCIYKLPPGEHVRDMAGLREMATRSLSMLDDALRAFETGEISLLEGFSDRDDIIDQMRYTIYEDCIRIMEEEPETIRFCTNYLLIARYLERCADHACKAAEKIHYMVSGERVDIR
ncbi:MULTISPECIES: phosphate uptake regulator PhoU [Methanocalculus]|uniref:phosphate signaling complex PhoU family protein n=1 Tax=Methanocalculus TaxID=71151 RepID=UPI00209D1E1D|nr:MULTISPECIES: PhoU domain-containing protein [unclassified Methanocalculus]MCP1661745.1 phosphate transport system protein [Methanocalculus sp. AMF5]